MAKTKKLTLDVDDMLDQVVTLGSGIAYLAKDSADELISVLEDRDLLNEEEGKKMAKDVREQFHSRKTKIKDRLKKELKRVIDEMGIATKEDLKKLR